MHTPTLELTVVETKLEHTIAQSGLEPQTADGLLQRFRPLFREAHALSATAQNINVTDATQVTEIKQARQVRLALRAVRIAAEKERKTLKEDSLRRGKAIDGVYNVLEYAVAPVEKRLLDMEEFAERAEAARKAALKASREELLQPYGVDPSFYSLGELSEDAFRQLLDGLRLAHEQKIEAARKAESERIAKEKAEAEERERIRLENERLKREAIEREAAAKVEREKAEAARRSAEEAAKKEREALEAKARAEREAAAKAQREAESKAKQEREAREKAEAEARKLREEEAERKRKAEAEAKKAAAAPDLEKAKAFARQVRGLIIADMATEQGNAAAKVIAEKQQAFAQWIEKTANEMMTA